LNKRYGTDILVSDAIRDRVQDLFRFEPVGSVTAKGMTREMPVYELTGATEPKLLTGGETDARHPAA
jgi:adenylate cyclase